MEIDEKLEGMNAKSDIIQFEYTLLYSTLLYNIVIIIYQFVKYVCSGLGVDWLALMLFDK